MVASASSIQEEATADGRQVLGSRGGRAGQPRSADQQHCRADEFRVLMSHWPTGITVVTSRDGPRPVGCTVNAMMSVSLVPPLLVVALAAESETLRAIRRTGAFGLNMLGADQHDLCQRFARGSQHDRFDRLPYRDCHQVPLLAGVTAAAVCAVRDISPQGDHMLIVAAPIWHMTREDGSPLLFHRSVYCHLGDRLAGSKSGRSR